MIKHGGQSHSQRRFQAAAVGAPIVTALVVGLIAYLYRRNSLYRRQMAGQQRLAELGEVARTLAHEIKNPLAAIRVQTGVLRRTLPEASEPDVRLIEEEVARLALLTDRIGTFLKDPRGEPRPIDPAEFVADLCRRFDGVAPPTGPEPPASVGFDPDRLRSVLENLIRNALESGEDPQVEVAVDRARKAVAIRVLDRGAGIPTEAADRIFDPFYTSKTRGSGVGLAIARRFVEAAGGRLEVGPREGGGTVASVILEER